MPEPQPSAQPAKASPEAFVRIIVKRCQQEKSKGYAAKLRRADNPDTESYSWDILAELGVNLEKDQERLIYATIGAALVHPSDVQTGKLRLGQALAQSYSEEGNESQSARARLRRLLACDSVEEACRVLRPLLRLIQSRVTAPLDYIRLLKQLLRFPYDPQAIKLQWAQEFFRPAQKEEANDVDGSLESVSSEWQQSSNPAPLSIAGGQS